jgi:hypothetical protein
MPKVPIAISHELPPEHRKSKVLAVAGILCLCLLLTPVIMEGATVCFAQWREILGGRAASAGTPLLDSIQDSVRASCDDIWGCVAPVFQRVPWSPKAVLPIAAVIMFCAMMMLKR